MMVPVTMDDFVQTLLQQKQNNNGDEKLIRSSVVVSDNARVFAEARPKTVSFDLRNLKNNQDEMQESRRRDHRWGDSNNNTTATTAICRDRWGSASPNNSDDCFYLPMPKRNMSPYSRPKKPSRFEPSSPGRVTQALLLQSLSDHLPDLSFDDQEDDLDSSTFTTRPLLRTKAASNDRSPQRPPRQQEQQRPRCTKQILRETAAFGMDLELSPEIFRLGREDLDDSSTGSTDCMDF